MSNEDDCKFRIEFDAKMDEDVVQDVSQFVKLMGVFFVIRNIFFICRSTSAAYNKAAKSSIDILKKVFPHKVFQ